MVKETDLLKKILMKAKFLFIKITLEEISVWWVHSNLFDSPATTLHESI